MHKEPEILLSIDGLESRPFPQSEKEKFHENQSNHDLIRVDDSSEKDGILGYHKAFKKFVTDSIGRRVSFQFYENFFSKCFYQSKGLEKGLLEQARGKLVVVKFQGQPI